MKLVFLAFSTVTFGCIPPLAAQVTETKTETEVTQSSNGNLTESKKTTVTTFNPEARTKVVQYFDPYKTSPYGLPPAFATKIKVQEIPAAWRTTRVAPGTVITERERSYLVEAPPELIKVMPPPPEGVRYYMAGSNIVAVNPTYQVVDSIRIPSVKFEAVQAVPAPAVEVVPVPPPVQKVETVEEVTVEEVKRR